MPYKSRIKAAREEFEKLSKTLDEQKTNGTPLGDLAAKRTKVYEELTRLQRLQWEEENERLNLDDDR